MTRMFFIRHAESRMNAEFPHLIGGRTNHSPLTDVGMAQAEKLGQRFKRENRIFDQWFTSPAIRTRETARIVSEIIAPKVTITADDRLQEVHQEIWEGLDRETTYTPDILKDMTAQRWHFKAPEGESQHDVERRMVEFTAECLEKYPGKDIIVFSHGVAIKCLIRFVQDWDPLNTYHTEMDNTGLTIIEFHDDAKKWRLRTLNDHAHLF